MSEKERPIPDSFENTQTVHLDSLFTRDVTSTGSFDIRGDIWSSTFGKVVQAMPVPALLIDEYHNVIVANEACGTISPDYEEILDAPFSGLFEDPATAQEGLDLLTEAFRNGSRQVGEGVLHIGKARIWARMTYRLIRIMDLRLVLLIVENLTREKQQILENKRLRQELEQCVEQRTVELRHNNGRLQLVIDEQERVKETLSRSEKLLQQVFNSMSSSVLVLGGEGEILLANRSARSLLHLEDNIIGQALHDVIPNGGVLMGNTDSRDQAEAVITLKDGTNRLLGYTCNPGGTEGTRIVVFRDITELVEKTERRRRAKELALVGEMISRLSHEIRNPLASIVVGLKTLQRATPQASQHGHILQLISEEVDSLTKTVNQLLEAARPSPSTPRLLYVEPLLERCLDANGLLAVRRGVKLGLVRDSASSAVIVDDRAMLRVLGSLVQNALDACSKGDIIRIGWRELDEAGKDELLPGFSGKVVVMFVEDTGSGIPDEVSLDQSQIFRAFVSTKVSGSGLGLTVARDLVESHGGVIMVDSLVDRGTTVEILLPSPEAIPCWDWNKDRAVDCPATKDVVCENCEVRSSGTGYNCWTVKGRTCHAETGLWHDSCLKCEFFRSSSLTPFFRSQLVGQRAD